MKTYEPFGSLPDRRTEELYGLLERMKGMNFQGKVSYLPEFFREMDRIFDQRLNIIKSMLQKEFLKIAEAVNDGVDWSEIANKPDHGGIGGLADDDHTQYYNSVRHTKAVHDALNINADMVDSKHASAFDIMTLDQETSIALTLDSTWRTYTFSSEVPAGSKFVILSFLGSTTGNNGRLAWGDYSQTFKVVDWRIAGASGTQAGGQAIVPLDGSLRASYYGATNTGVTINCYVVGYIS